MTKPLFGPYLLDSSLALGTLSRCREEWPGKTIAIIESLRAASEPPSWDHHWTDGSETVLSLHRAGDSYLLRFPGLADFMVQPQARRISVVARGTATDDATLEHLLIDQVLPRYLAHEGMLSLHACAIKLRGKCLLVLGSSGAGKSTLAAFMAAAGHTLLSDDCTLLRIDDGRALAMPTYPSLRLLPDSIDALDLGGADLQPMAHYSRKQRVIGRASDASGLMKPVDHLVILDAAEALDSQPKLHPMTVAEACLAMVRHSFQLDPTDMPRIASHLRTCSAIARTQPAFHLRYPRRYDRVADVVALLERHVAGRPAMPA